MPDDHEAKERKNMMKYGMLEDDVNPMLSETKMWITEDAVSQWAYYQCLKLKEDNKPVDPELKDMIITSKWAYMYCQHVEDEFDMRQKIVESEWILNYCTQIRDDNEVMKRLTDPADAQLYFQYKKDRLESRVQIYSSEQQRKEADHQDRKIRTKSAKRGPKKDEVEDPRVILNESNLPEFIEVSVRGKKIFKRVKDIVSKIKRRKKR
jgi:hypothetical protein